MTLKRYKVFASYEGKLLIDADDNGEFVYAEDAIREIEELESEIKKLRGQLTHYRWALDYERYK